jgi:CheY-like chemotaxis protein
MTANNGQDTPAPNQPLVLIVEDSFPQMLKTRLILESIGCHVVWSDTGTGGLSLARENTFDLIVLDIELPDINGFEVCRSLKADPELVDIPVIMLTSLDQADTAENGFTAGAIDYIPKDAFADAVLVETIKQMTAIDRMSQSTIDNSRDVGETREQISKGAAAQGNIPSVEPEHITKRKSEIERRQVLDPAALDRLLEVIGGNPVLLAELIDSFLEEAPLLLVQLRQALEQDDAPKLRRAAHTIKPCSNDFGATRLAELCQTLEDIGKVGTIDGAADLVIDVEIEYELVKVALEQVRDRQIHTVGEKIT